VKFMQDVFLSICVLQISDVGDCLTSDLKGTFYGSD